MAFMMAFFITSFLFMMPFLMMFFIYSVFQDSKSKIEFRYLMALFLNDGYFTIFKKDAKRIKRIRGKMAFSETIYLVML